MLPLPSIRVPCIGRSWTIWKHKEGRPHPPRRLFETGAGVRPRLTGFRLFLALGVLKERHLYDTCMEMTKAKLKARAKAYYAKNKAKLKARRKAYSGKNKAKLKARVKAYRAKHKAKIAARMKTYSAKHKVRIAAYCKAYRARNKAEIAAYAKAYRAKHKADIAAYAKAYHAKTSLRVRQHSGHLAVASVGL